MRTLTGLLTLSLVLAAGCTANEPTVSDDGGAPSAVLSEVPDAENASTGVGSPFRRTVHSIQAGSDGEATPVTPAESVPDATATGEPWLEAVAWITIVSDVVDDPRLETVAERVPSSDARPPLATQVVAERPARPHDHTHPGNG